ncbi:MAG: hypothetical protein CMJ58_15075 [Planctomycetaceae bacterium]|nr:hypothetical protein [Planctomycetaceae bacterium]
MPAEQPPDDSPKPVPFGGRQIDEHARVDACIYERLRQHAHGHCFGRVTWRYTNRTLVLEGIVPSFYLKQMLQSILSDIENVEQVVNQVAVVSSTGLSSECEP